MKLVRRTGWNRYRRRQRRYWARHFEANRRRHRMRGTIARCAAWMILLSMSAALVVGALACAKPKPEPALPAPVIIERRACITTEPPKAKHRPIDPDEFLAMEPRDQLVVLLELLHDLSVAQRDRRHIQTLCGPLPAETLDGGPTP